MSPLLIFSMNSVYQSSSVIQTVTTLLLVITVTLLNLQSVLFILQTSHYQFVKAKTVTKIGIWGIVMGPYTTCLALNLANYNMDALLLSLVFGIVNTLIFLVAWIHQKRLLSNEFKWSTLQRFNVHSAKISRDIALLHNVDSNGNIIISVEARLQVLVTILILLILPSILTGLYSILT